MLNDQPELFDHLAANWTAFCRLDHARNHSFGYPQPITIADIKAYADTHNLFGDDALELMNHVSILDREYMRISSEMHEKKRKKK